MTNGQSPPKRTIILMYGRSQGKTLASLTDYLAVRERYRDMPDMTPGARKEPTDDGLDAEEKAE